MDPRDLRRESEDQHSCDCERSATGAQVSGSGPIWIIGCRPGRFPHGEDHRSSPDEFRSSPLRTTTPPLDMGHLITLATYDSRVPPSSVVLTAEFPHHTVGSSLRRNLKLNMWPTDLSQLIKSVGFGFSGLLLFLRSPVCA